MATATLSPMPRWARASAEATYYPSHPQAARVHGGIEREAPKGERVVGGGAVDQDVDHDKLTKVTIANGIASLTKIGLMARMRMKRSPGSVRCCQYAVRFVVCQVAVPSLGFSGVTSSAVNRAAGPALSLVLRSCYKLFQNRHTTIIYRQTSSRPRRPPGGYSWKYTVLKYSLLVGFGT